MNMGDINEKLKDILVTEGKRHKRCRCGKGAWYSSKHIYSGEI